MKSSTALLVIDMQTCAFDGKLCPPMDNSFELLERIEALIESARANALPVVYLQHCATEGNMYAQGSASWSIYESLAPVVGEHIVLKKHSNGFEQTTLDSVLTHQGIDSVITCGIQSEFCVKNTSIAALERKFSVTLAADAHSTNATDLHSANDIINEQNTLLAVMGAKVVKTDKLCKAFRDV